MINIGDYVELPKRKEEWGIGKVIDKSGTRKDPRVSIFFSKVGSKLLLATAPFVTVAEDDVSEADKLYLDNIYTDSDKSKKSNLYLGIPDAIKGFKHLLKVDDFSGKNYLETERNYKIEFHEKATNYFNKDDLERLIEESNYTELLDRLKKFFSAQDNLLSHFEHLKLKDSVAESEANQKSFFTALYTVLYGNKFDADFTNWINILNELGHAKWALATIFLFSIYPDKYMFVKPDTTKTAAEIANFYINYNSTPTIDTYNRILSFSKFLFLQIEELKPKDMIDVQGFMWCIKPETIDLIKKYQDDEEGYWKK